MHGKTGFWYNMVMLWLPKFLQCYLKTGIIGK